MTIIQSNGTIESRVDRHWWIVLGAIVGIGALVRLTHAILFVRHPFGAMAWIDEQAYWERAREILEVSAWPTRPFYQDPLYPYFLAFLIKILGPSLIAVRVVLSLCGIFTPFFVGLAARAGFGRMEGWIAAALASLYGPLVFTDCLLEKEGLGALFAAVALWVTALSLRKNGLMRLSFVAGAFWGLLALLRSNALLVGPIGVAVIVLMGFPEKKTRSALLRALAFAMGFLAPILPIAAINASLTNPPELIVTTWQSGANFYIGNGPEATGVYSSPDFVNPHPFYEADDYAREAAKRSGRDLSPNEISRFWFRQGLRFWREHPRDSLRLWLKKLTLLLNDYEVGDNHNFELTRCVLWPSLAPAVSSFGLVFPLSLLGLSIRRTSRNAYWVFVATTTYLGLFSTSFFFVVGRYRIPWVPGLAVLSGAGAGEFVKSAIEGRRLANLLRLAFLFAPAFLFARTPPPVPLEERWGHAQKRLFVAETNAGRIDAAIDALDDGRALGKTPMAHFNRLLGSSGEIKDLEAIIASRLKMRRLFGDSSDLQTARWLRILPRARERSRMILKKLREESPKDPGVRREWACWMLGETTDLNDARARALIEFRRAVELGDASAAVDLALLTRDPTVLDRAGLDWSVVQPYRLRLARDVLR